MDTVRMLKYMKSIKHVWIEVVFGNQILWVWVGQGYAKKDL